jgi:hypothetical protein
MMCTLEREKTPLPPSPLHSSSHGAFMLLRMLHTAFPHYFEPTQSPSSLFCSPNCQCVSLCVCVRCVWVCMSRRGGIFQAKANKHRTHPSIQTWAFFSGTYVCIV